MTGPAGADVSRESLAASEIVDWTYPLTGAPAWFPHGFELARRLLEQASAALEAEGYEPAVLPTLVPLELFRVQASEIKDFTRRLYTSGPSETERYVLAPTMEAQVSAVFRDWLEAGQRLPFHVYTVRQVARHENGRLAPSGASA